VNSNVKFYKVRTLLVPGVAQSVYGLCYGLDGWGIGVWLQALPNRFRFYTAIGVYLEPTQPSNQMMSGHLFRCKTVGAWRWLLTCI